VADPTAVDTALGAVREAAEGNDLTSAGTAAEHLRTALTDL
jgi:hypothetical protein